MKKFVAALLCGFCFVFGAAGCASSGGSSSSTPGTPIVSFPNTTDHLWSTALLSQPFAAQAGVRGRALTVELLHYNTVDSDLLTIDEHGNVGIRGSLSSLSSAREKTDIRTFSDNAVTILSRVKVVRFRYKGENSNRDPHIGFIAERTPAQLSGSHHDSMNLDNTIAVNIAATQELARTIVVMQSRIDRLNRLVAELKARNP